MCFTVCSFEFVQVLALFMFYLKLMSHSIVILAGAEFSSLICFMEVCLQRWGVFLKFSSYKLQLTNFLLNMILVIVPYFLIMFIKLKKWCFKVKIWRNKYS